MSGIVLSSAVRSNLITLQNTAQLQAKVQERLSTGKKVNSALDNPTNFFTASGLNRRASDLGALLDGMSQGIKTLEAADNAMSAINKTVESMQANIRQARQDKSFKGLSVNVDATAVGTAAVKNLSFSGGAVGTTPVNVALNTADVGGTVSSQVTSSAYAAPTAAGKATYTAAAAYTTPGSTQALDITFGGVTTSVSLTTADTAVTDAVTTINAAITGAGRTDIEAFNSSGKLQIRTTGNVDGSITVAGAGETGTFGSEVSVAGSDGQSTFTVNGTAVTMTTAESSVALAVTKANADLGASNTVEAYDAGSSKLGFRNKAVGTTAITIAGTDASLFAAATAGTAPTTPGSVKTVDQLVTAINSNTSLAGKVKASNDGGKLRIDNLSTESLSVVGASATDVNGGTGNSNTQTIAGNDVRKNLMGQFNDLRKQLDKLAGDGSYNGINLVRADKLKISFNETGTSSIEIQAKDTAGAVRGIGTEASSLNIGAADATEFSSDTNLDTRLDHLNDSLTTLQTQSSSFGAALTTVQNRQDFTKAMINTLQQGADGLTLADSNEEGANLLSLNTRQQLSQTALSLASQASQAVLRLF